MEYLNAGREVIVGLSPASDTLQAGLASREVIVGLAPESDTLQAGLAGRDVVVGLSPEPETLQAGLAGRDVVVGLSPASDTPPTGLAGREVIVGLSPASDTLQAGLTGRDVVVGLSPESDTLQAGLAGHEVIVGRSPASDTLQAGLAGREVIVGLSPASDTLQAGLAGRDVMVEPRPNSDPPLVTQTAGPVVACGVPSIVVDEVSGKPPSGNILDKLVGASPTAEIEINGVPVGCVLDTGAEASLLPSSFYHQHLRGGLTTVGTFMKVVGANDLEVPVKGFLGVPIKVFGDTFMANFCVKPDGPPCSAGRRLDYPVILGCNVLRDIAKLAVEPSGPSKDDWQLALQCLHVAAAEASAPLS